MAAEQLIADRPQSSEDSPGPELGGFTRLKYMFVRGFLWAWASCFSLKGLYLFGQMFGFCEWVLNYKRRRRFHEQMRRVFGQALDRGECADVRWACLRHFTRTRCDKLLYLIFDKLPREKILKRIKFHRKDILDDAVARNKGVYVCLSHNGSHHVLILLMALMGYKVAGVRDRNEAPLRRYVQERYEETFPEIRAVRMFFADTYPRALYRCFEEGYILGTALDVGRDRGARLKTASVKMFGEDKKFLTGTMQIALRCGAPILQGFVVSRKNFYFRLIVKEPLVDPDIEADEPAIVEAAMQKYADNIAAHIAHYPCHLSKS